MKIQPIHHGEYRSGRKNDCVVRALSNCTFLSYSVCEDVVGCFGRGLNEGTSPKALVKSCLYLGLSGPTMYGKTKRTEHFERYVRPSLQEQGMTLKTFLRLNPKGRFFVVYCGHALAVIDGQIIDTIDSNGNNRIIISFQDFR